MGLQWNIPLLSVNVLTQQSYYLLNLNRLLFFFSVVSDGIVQAMMAMVNFCDNCLRKKEEGSCVLVNN